MTQTNSGAVEKAFRLSSLKVCVRYQQGNTAEFDLNRGPLVCSISEPQSPVQQQSSYIEHSIVQYIRVLDSAGTGSKSNVMILCVNTEMTMSLRSSLESLWLFRQHVEGQKHYWSWYIVFVHPLPRAASVAQ